MSSSLALLLTNPVVIAAIFCSGIGGTFQYGFSISVMTSPSDFIKEFVNRTCVQRYRVPLEQWQVSLIWSVTVSIFCIGGLLGSFAAGLLTTSLGRKKCLWVNNFVAISAALLMLLSKEATSFEMIMIGRFVYGINSGIALSGHTLYLVECAPKMLRGMVGVTVATFISCGKFCGQLLGISELLGTEERWPWLLGFNGFTALLQLFTLPLLPESPQYLLLHKGDRPGCDKAMRTLWGDKDHSAEVEEMLVQHVAAQGVRSRSVLELIRDPNIRRQLLTIVVTFSTLQLCGINAVYFYSFEVFRRAGFQEQQLRYAALGTGLCELCSSLACFVIIESTGKKALLCRGYLGMAATLVLLTITLNLQDYVYWMPYCSMVLLFIFITLFSSGPAGTTAPLPGEIFSQSFKSAAFTIACTLNWLAMFSVGMLFPTIVDYLGSFCFLIFLFFCSACGLFVWFYVPETKHRSLLEITADFERMHRKPDKWKQSKKDHKTKANGAQAYETKF